MRPRVCGAVYFVPIQTRLHSHTNDIVQGEVVDQKKRSYDLGLQLTAEQGRNAELKRRIITINETYGKAVVCSHIQTRINTHIPFKRAVSAKFLSGLPFI